MSVCCKEDVLIDRLLHPDSNPHRMTHLVPNYTTDVREDYQVLVHAREKFDGKKLASFTFRLFDIWEAREAPFPVTAYMPGDYSRAALDVSGAEQEAPCT